MFKIKTHQVLASWMVACPAVCAGCGDVGQANDDLVGKGIEALSASDRDECTIDGIGLTDGKKADLPAFLSAP